MLNKHFFNSLPLIAATLSKKHGITVRFQGTQAYVMMESRQITLPSESFFDKSQDENENSHKKKITLGYLIHEASHVAFSLFSEMEAKKTLTSLEENFFAFMIDGKDERLMVNKYRGTQGYLFYLAKEKLKRSLEGISGITKVFSYYLMFYVRHIGQNGVFPKEISESRKALLEYLPEDLIFKLEIQAKKGVFASTLYEITDAAKEMAKLLKEYLEQEKQKQQPQQSDQSGDNQDEQEQSGSSDESQDDNSGGSGSGSEEDDDSGEQEEEKSQGNSPSGDSNESESSEATGDSLEDSDSQSSSGNNGDSGNQEEEKSQGNSSSEDNKGNQEAIEQLLRELEEMSQDDAQKDASVVNESYEEQGNSSGYRNFGNNTAFQGMPGIDKACLKTCKLDLSDIKKKSVVLRTRIANYLQAEKMEKSMTARRGRLATNKLHKLAVNDDRVFQKRQPVKSNSVAIHLLLDGSCSMGWKELRSGGKLVSRADIAYPAAQAFALAVSNYSDINVGASIFCQKYNEKDDSYLNQIVPVLNHGQRITPNTNWGFIPYGNTPLAEGIYYAWSELMSQPEERRIMILLTDGEADNPATASEMVALCKRSGVEIVGLSIGSDYLQQYLEKGAYEVVNDDTEIVNAYFSILQRLLVSNKR